MTKAHYIPVTDETGEVSERMKALIRKAIRTGLAQQGVTVRCEVDVAITDDEGIRILNREMRGVDAATDVLSFPALELEPGVLPTEEDADPGTGLVPLGDMAISMEHVTAQAEEYGHSFERELIYLFTHSVLHLLGYDHETEDERIEMEKLQEEILNRKGYTRDVQ